MTHGEFLLAMDELLEVDPGTLKGSEKLEELESWDSLSVVSFMALAKARFNKTIPAKGIAACQSIDDLFAMVGSQPA